MVLSRSSLLEPEDLPPSIRHCGPTVVTPEVGLGEKTLTEMVEELEKSAIARALEMTGGVRTKAAEILGISERNLRYKMEKYHVEGR